MNLKNQYRNALIYVTKRCNLRCPRCFLSDLKPEQRRDMTWDEYVRIITRIQEQGVTLNLLHFTGGEPTLWPYLIDAIEYARQARIAKWIRVVTNAVDRNIKDYGNADIVHISHYGALNRADIVRLKQQGQWRVKVQYTVHLPWPFPDNPNALPSDCGCINMAFLGDRVYPCGLAAARETDNYFSVEDDFYNTLVQQTPYYQSLCRSCVSNRKNKVHHMTGLTAEFGVWDSPISYLWDFKHKGLWLRKIYRRLTA
jgi:hypothetical protein